MPLRRSRSLGIFLALLTVLLGFLPSSAPPALRAALAHAAAPPALPARPRAPGQVLASRAVPHPQPPPPSLPSHAAPLPTAMPDLGALPLPFVPNRGQSEQSVRFSLAALGGR